MVALGIMILVTFLILVVRLGTDDTTASRYYDDEDYSNNYE